MEFFCVTRMLGRIVSLENGYTSPKLRIYRDTQNNKRNKKIRNLINKRSL